MKAKVWRSRFVPCWYVVGPGPLYQLHQFRTWAEAMTVANRLSAALAEQP